MKFGTLIFPKPDTAARDVRLAEERGFATAWVPDSHMIWGDTYACMALAATATKKIRLGTGVAIATNRIPPVTVHSISTGVPEFIEISTRTSWKSSTGSPLTLTMRSPACNHARAPALPASTLAMIGFVTGCSSPTIAAAAAVMFSTFGTLNGSIFTSPRIFYAMADEGMLFQAFRRVHPRFNTRYASGF